MLVPAIRVTVLHETEEVNKSNEVTDEGTTSAVEAIDAIDSRIDKR